MYCKLFLRGVVDSSGAIAMVLPLASQKVVLFPDVSADSTVRSELSRNGFRLPDWVADSYIRPNESQHERLEKHGTGYFGD